MFKQVFNFLADFNKTIWIGIILLIMFLMGGTVYIWLALPGIKLDYSYQDKCTSPYMLVFTDNAAESALALKSNNISVKIAGVVSQVHVSQVYKFNARKKADMVLMFPAGANTTMGSAKITIGKRVISSEVVSKDQLQKKGEDITPAKASFFVDAQKNNVFQLMIRNVEPTDTNLVVELNYFEQLYPNHAYYEFYYPATIEPKYRKISDSLITDAEFEQELKVKEEPTNYITNIQVKLAAGLKISDLKCVSHTIDTQELENNELECNLSANEQFMGSKPFLLHYSLSQEKIDAGLLLYKEDTSNYFLCHIQPPKVMDENLLLPREYIFIVDISQSMRDFAFQGTKQLIKNLLTDLTPGDRFNIILFNNTDTIFSSKSSVATSRNVKDALKFIDKQEITGGSQIFRALKRAVDLPISQGYSRSFVLVTDGYFENEHKVLRYIYDNFSKANFFAFGIGTAVNHNFVEKIAQAGMGEMFVATSAFEVNIASNRLKDYIEKPILRNIKLSFSGTNVVDVHPLSIPDAFSEKPVIITGRINGKLSGIMKISGETGSSNFYMELPLKNYFSENASAVKPLWQKSQVKFLEDNSLDDNVSKQNELITSLGIGYGQITDFTAFVQKDNYLYYTKWQLTPQPFGFEKLDFPQKTGKSAVNLAKNAKEPDEIFYLVDEMPSFSGGIGELNQFFAKNAKIPDELKNSGLSGNVYLLFVVDEKGQVSGEKIVRKLHPILDNEALRLIRMTSGLWLPGRHKGKVVKVYYNLPIRF